MNIDCEKTWILTPSGRWVKVEAELLNKMNRETGYVVICISDIDPNIRFDPPGDHKTDVAQTFHDC